MRVKHARLIRWGILRARSEARTSGFEVKDPQWYFYAPPLTMLAYHRERSNMLRRNPSNTNGSVFARGYATSMDNAAIWSAAGKRLGLIPPPDPSGARPR